MYGIINWICLICISFLVLDVMVYFCKDAVKVIETSQKPKSKVVRKTKRYVYENKIAK
ncbi:hypothetical protein [Romboutsia sp.]|uniref:hypothetical protein n=1 Tax=Romboutsia sp. TaxID=1965302 RepID=UPI003F32EF5F